MNKQINPYLMFKGNCREAMTFYKECLGGELTIQNVEDTSMKDQSPTEVLGRVMHAALMNEGIVLFASDMMDDTEEAVHGNRVTLCLNCKQSEIQDLFNKLSQGAQYTKEPKTEFWGSIYAEVVDKHGFRWMLNADPEQHAA